MMGLYEGLLGIKRDYAGLRIAPCFPGAWAGAEAVRSFRGAEYRLTYRNPGHLEAGQARITVDGVPLDGNLLPEFRDGRRHEVEIIFET